MTRFAIYARYSSDRQSERSIEDQVRLCREYAEDGGEVVEVYTDFAISGGHSVNRPSFLRLMNDAKEGLFDAIVTEALDRLSRDQEDIAAAYKRLTHRGIKIFTLSEGEINELHIGIKGTMNALQLKDLAIKTRRGQRGRVEDGAIPGGLTFGYKIIRKLDSQGEPIRGLREINEEQADIVRRIFREYLSGLSGRTIAAGLNRDKIPSPRGGHWNASAINGHKTRRNGILNNELYNGRIVYNRQTFLKNPETGKRTARINPEKDWVVKYVPDLKIIDDETWAKAHEAKKVFASVPMAKARRPNKYPLSGLLYCDTCGGKYSIVGRDRYGCINFRERGTCKNNSTFSSEILHREVLKRISFHMQDPEQLKEFNQLYHEQRHELKLAKIKERNAMVRRLAEVERQIEGVINAVLNGMYHNGLKTKMSALEAEKKDLNILLEEKEDNVIDVHPNLAFQYAQKLDDLYTSLFSDSETEMRQQAIRTLRTLVEKVVISRDQNTKELELEIHGKLAEIMYFMNNQQKKTLHSDECRVTVVAGAGFGYNHILMPSNAYVFKIKRNSAWT